MIRGQPTPAPEKGEYAAMSTTAARRGHPTEGVFMKCWRCQETQRLTDDGGGGLRCPICWEILIPLEWR
jgi:hypothetical protein